MAARAEHDMVAATTHLRRSIRLAERAGDTRLTGAVRISLALALAYRGLIAAGHRELDRAETELDGHDLARVELQRAGLFQLEGRLEEAHKRFSAALPPLQGAGDTPALAILYNNRGLVQSLRGVLASAEADLRRAVELHHTLGDERSAAESAQNLGLVAARRGNVVGALAAFDDVDRRLAASGNTDAIGLMDRSYALLAARLTTEARETAERALREQERRQLTVYTAEAQLVLARIALLDGRLEEARQLADTSASAFARQRRSSYRAAAEEVSVRAAWLSGDRSPALLAASRRAARALAAAGWVVAAADSHLVAGQVALALGRTKVTRAELGAVAVARRTDPAELRSRAFHARALLHLANGDTRRAESALRAGLAVVDRYRQALAGTELRVHASGQATELARLGLRLAVQRGEPRRILQWAERWRAGTISLRPVQPPDDEALATTLAELRQTIHAQQETNATDGAPARKHAGGSDASAARLLRRQAALERRVRELTRQGAGTDRYHVLPPQPAQIRAALGDHVLLELVETDGDLYAVVLTGRRQTLHRLAPVAQVGRLISILRFLLLRLVVGFGSPAALQTAARSVEHTAAELDAVLLRPLAGRLEDRPLVIVPTTVLHALPWAMLPSCRGRSISIAPSAAWWWRATTTEPPPAGGPGQVVLVSGPDLEGGAAEVHDLAELHPEAVVLTGSSATAAAVADALDGASLAHIAAHGTFRADQPLMSCLRLADGPLMVYDLERLRYAPRQLVLASCDAGLSGIRPGDELMGVAAALLAQGTNAVVAPLLPVPDSLTRPVMHTLHTELKTRRSLAAALATAQQAAPEGLPRLAAATFACLGTDLTQQGAAAVQ
jgi:tetratricopeptide (TPR) repeat protein